MHFLRVRTLGFLELLIVKQHQCISKIKLKLSETVLDNRQNKPNKALWKCCQKRPKNAPKMVQKWCKNHPQSSLKHSKFHSAHFWGFCTPKHDHKWPKLRRWVAKGAWGGFEGGAVVGWGEVVSWDLRPVFGTPKPISPDIVLTRPDPKKGSADLIN